MTDLLDASGLQVSTLPEIKASLIADFKAIYGDDINVDQNSPDGQIIGIVSQLALDLRELLVQINNGFDPDQAVGVILDQRTAINNITRQGGTFTTQPIDIVVDRTVTLQGLDGNFSDPDGVGFTIQDDAGNEFILIDSATLTAGSYTKNFRAREVGLVETTIGTITNFVTIVLGVVSVNNSSGVLQSGSNEETDAALRVRRQRSVAISSEAYLNGIEAALLNLDGVTGVRVYENFTNVEDADGIPAHGMWAIVEAGSNEDIADVIYRKKSYGCNMKGDVSITVARPEGDDFIAKFDRPTPEDLYIQFDIQPTITGAVFDLAAIKAAMVEAISYNIGDYAETSNLTGIALTAILSLGGGGVPVNMEISLDDATWLDYIDPSAKDNQFTIDATRISITEL